MEIEEEDRQPFQGLAPLETVSDRDFSESEDEGLGSLADQGYDNLTIPQNMKNILSMDSYRHETDLQDDSESDDDSVFHNKHKVDIEALNATLAANKFANFPLMPADETAKEKTKPKKTKKPREKKKRRDKVSAQEKKSNKALADLFTKHAMEASDSESEEPKKKGRKTRKSDALQDKVDENGERIVRSTEFLDTDTDDSEQEDRVLSKKQELEMARESERLRRSTQARLKPTTLVKSYDDFIKRREQRELDLLQQLEEKSKREIDTLIQEKQEQEHRAKIADLMKRHKRPVVLQDSDDDLIIENDPSQIAAAAMQSPERARIPAVSLFSPNRAANASIRDHNKSILQRITTQGYEHRIKMEETAKARGQFASATERAKRLLEKEKNARIIDAQVRSHFEKHGFKQQQEEEEDDEEDEDYQEEDADDAMQEDQEEEEDDDDEFALDQYKADSPPPQKRKNTISDQEESDQEDVPIKRAKGKKPKKSIFDESDDEEDVIKKQSKPVPAHSISNFFKAKTNVVPDEPMEEKQLGRLKRRTIQPDVDEDEDDPMELDDEKSNIETRPRSPKPKKPLEKSEYLEEEAEEEEDEFFGAGGDDDDHGEDLDKFEEDDMLVHHNTEKIDEAALRDVFNKQDAESDNNFIQRLLTDVTGGGLRKQKAAAEAGLMIEDIDLYDEEDNDLIAIRRAAAARRRKMLKKKGGDPLENLLADPKTAAFAKAGQAINAEEAEASLLSDSDAENLPEEEEIVTPAESKRAKLIIEESDEEDDDDLEDYHHTIDDEHLIVDDFDPMASPVRPTMSPARTGQSSVIRNTTLLKSKYHSPVRATTNPPLMASPLRGGLVSSSMISEVTSAADEEDDELQIESLTSSSSPLNNRKTKLFRSPARQERFKRLITETNSSGSDVPRVGFGSVTKPQGQDNEEGDNPANTKGSIGGFLATARKPNEPRKSKLSALAKQSVFD